MELLWFAALTIAIELPVLACFGYWRGPILGVFALVNLATNISLNLVLVFWPTGSWYAALAVGEITVAVVEWLVLRGFLLDRTPGWRLPLAVLTANAASLATGILLNW